MVVSPGSLRNEVRLLRAEFVGKQFALRFQKGNENIKIRPIPDYPLWYFLAASSRNCERRSEVIAFR
jgi:hypothetical protein